MYVVHFIPLVEYHVTQAVEMEGERERKRENYLIQRIKPKNYKYTFKYQFQYISGKILTYFYVMVLCINP